MVSVGVALRWVTAAKRPFWGFNEQLPDAERYRSDRYVVYGWLPRNRHVARKGGEVNWNEGLHSRLRDRLRRLQRKTKGYKQERDDTAGIHISDIPALGLI